MSGEPVLERAEGFDGEMVQRVIRVPGVSGVWLGDRPRSRKRRRAGDVFAASFSEGYVYGRIVVDHSAAGPDKDGEVAGKTGWWYKDFVVAYFYYGLFDTFEMPDRSHFRFDNHIPEASPLIVAKTFWTTGLVETVGNLAIEPGEIATPITFWNNQIAIEPSGRAVSGWVDEMGNPIDNPQEPTGTTRLKTDLGLANVLRKAHGLAKPIPDQP